MRIIRHKTVHDNECERKQKYTVAESYSQLNLYYDSEKTGYDKQTKNKNTNTVHAL